MDRFLIVALQGGSDAEVDAFCRTLPANILQYRVGGWRTFRIPLSQQETARELRHRARAAQLASDWAGETMWSIEDHGKGRLCMLLPPAGPSLDEKGFVNRRRCASCGARLYSLAAEPRLDIPLRSSRPLPPVFASRSGLVTIISAAAEAELRAAGLMTGGSSLPVTANGSPTREYRALVATLPLGDVVGDAHARQCPECGRTIMGEGFFFPLYRHPPERGNLYYSYVFGPTNPFVSEAFARAVGRIVGEPPDAPLSFVGWYPDDYEQARLPAYDDDD